MYQSFLIQKKNWNYLFLNYLAFDSVLFKVDFLAVVTFSGIFKFVSMSSVFICFCFINWLLFWGCDHGCSHNICHFSEERCFSNGLIAWNNNVPVFTLLSLMYIPLYSVRHWSLVRNLVASINIVKLIDTTSCGGPIMLYIMEGLNIQNYYNN